MHYPSQSVKIVPHVSKHVSTVLRSILTRVRKMKVKCAMNRLKQTKTKTTRQVKQVGYEFLHFPRAKEMSVSLYVHAK